MVLLRRYLIAGLLIWAPILVTFFIIEFLLKWLDQLIALIPKHYQPETLLHVHIPGLSLVVIFLVVILTGLLATNVFGRFLVNLGEKILNKIPLVRTIYSSVKQVVHSIFSAKNAAFRKVLLVPFPSDNSWVVAFQTGNGLAEINKKLGTKMITVFVPSAPFPTSGFLLVVSAEKVIELDISVDTALKLVISMGVLQQKTEDQGQKIE